MRPDVNGKDLYSALCSLMLDFNREIMERYGVLCVFEHVRIFSYINQ